MNISLFLSLAIMLPLMMRELALTALKLGDEKASGLGVNVESLRVKVFVLSPSLQPLLFFVGTIGFIGIVGPHIARMLVGRINGIFTSLCSVWYGDLVASAGE
ncbi:MAG: iron chelate uptake ABC transporter family permease subunit [Veillonella sp.]